MAMREYQPFAYPPDYILARIHQEASKPGKIDPTNSVICPCCSLPTKTELTSWFNRSIDQDFKNYGGAVVTYFWLVKLYIFACLLILLLYSSYLIRTIHNTCVEISQDSELKCETFMGLYIITNQSLFEQLRKFNHRQSMTRILTLRTITFAILLISNFLALYTAGRFKRRYPQHKKIHNFSLIFKNVRASVEDFTLEIKSKFPQAEMVEVFNIRTLEPFYTTYNQKLQTYYLSLIELNPKNKDKLLKKLRALDSACQKQQSDYEKQSDRIIVVFESEALRNEIKKKYQLKGVQKAKYVLGLQNSRNQMYCEECPTCEQIIWNNIGSDDTQKIKAKVISVVYFFLLLGGSYLFLFFCMHLVYDRETLPKPLNQILANLVMILMVPVAITFRQLMDKLSQMRHPNTQTHRTVFIILTVLLFHFIYYLLIPTFYLNFSKKVQQNQVLYIVTNQTFTFLVVQFILAYLDFIFCMWNRRLKKVQNEAKPIGCQKILHQKIQYPRFPIEFKHIILFKAYSLIILFAFESPFIMFVSTGFLIILYFTDKLSVYRHYRMEIIDNKIQFNFLKVYSVFFSAYTFLIYSLTQHFDDLSIQFYAAMILTIVAILLQIFYIKDKVFEDETILPSTLQEEKIDDSYKKRFNKFRENVVDDKTNSEIKQYLFKLGQGSLQTEESLSKLKLIDS